MANCNIETTKAPATENITPTEKHANRQHIMEILLSSDLPNMTDELAAAVCGNIYGESGYNQYAVNPSSGAYGLCQWLYYKRVENLKAYAKECGRSVSNFEVQVNFMIKELKEGTTWRKMTALTDNVIENAVSIFCNYFENPGKDVCAADHPKRLRAAKNALISWRSKNPTVPLE